MEHNIDATGEKLGRLATRIAILLMGKNKADFKKNVVADVKVNISNASKLDISVKKMKEKEYSRYSGYPGGRKVEKMDKVIQKKGYNDVLTRAVRGMLPGNKLRPQMLKNLKITE
ncbi:MAG: 50S ribosomal protein L13 [Candidatus Pacebacteria bacterium]|nr:50S ribosomal protein L13 [Candidatus Paceibacterota bacterium]